MKPPDGSSNARLGATLFVEILNPDSGQWDFVDGVAAYGKAEFGGGGFTAPNAGNYKMRARCAAFRMRKFMIQIRVSGRRITPFYGGSECKDCGTDNLPVELSQGRTQTTTYDAFGHVTSVTSPRGVKQIATWNYSNWSLGRLVQTSVQNGNGDAYAPTTYNYFEPSGLLQSVVSPHPEAGGGTVTSQFTYDSYGNPLTATEPGENAATRTTTFSYTQDGTYSQPMFVGRPIAIADALGHTTHLRYDARGNALSSTDALGATTEMTYDVADAPTSVIYPASGQTGNGNGRTDYSYSYTGGPLRTSTTRDEAGAVVRATSQTYGNEGELIMQSGDQTSQSISYDALYRTVAIWDGNGNATNYYYDGNGRATVTAYPGADPLTGFNMERTTAFDDSGLPLQTVDGRGVVSNIAYTPDGLPASVSYPASPGENVTLTYNSFGQPTGRADASGEESYAYNNRGLMMSQSTRYFNAAGNLMNPFVQTQHFYGSGALQQLATTLGNQSYAYDAAGRLTGLSDPDNDVTAWNYDARDQLQSQTLSTGTTTALTHNVLGQLTSQRNANASNITLSSWGHPSDGAQKQLYNALGQLTRNTAFSTPTYNWGGTTTYAYDNRSQLSGESSTRGAGYTHNFGYSGAANPTNWKGQSRTFNTNNQETTGNAFLYDGAGNTTQMPNGNLAAPGVAAPTQKLIYNAQGQLAQLRDANDVVIATYVYRGDGKRAWKELANGTRSYFYYAGEQLIAGTNGVDASGLQLWGADGLVGSRSFNSTTNVTTKSYNLYDTQGNLAQTVNAHNGNIVSKRAVNAWGEPIRDSAGNVAGAGFGYIRDGESGF